MQTSAAWRPRSSAGKGRASRSSLGSFIHSSRSCRIECPLRARVPGERKCTDWTRPQPQRPCGTVGEKDRCGQVRDLAPQGPSFSILPRLLSEMQVAGPMLHGGLRSPGHGAWCLPPSCLPGFLMHSHVSAPTQQGDCRSGNSTQGCATRTWATLLTTLPPYSMVPAGQTSLAPNTHTHTHTCALVSSGDLAGGDIGELGR